jgi:hypothetical protein
MAGASRHSRVLLLLAVLVFSVPSVLLVALLATISFRSGATPAVVEATDTYHPDEPPEAVKSVSPLPQIDSNSSESSSGGSGSHQLLNLFRAFVLDLGVSNLPRTAQSPLPKIDSGTPLAALLPPPPTVRKVPVYLGDDLARVPELKLEAAPVEELTTEQWVRRKTHTVAAALQLNGKEDGFLKALLRSRPDLGGVSFVMGDDCRTESVRAKIFKDAALGVQRGAGAALLKASRSTKLTKMERQQSQEALIAVMAQVLPAKEVADQQGLIATLASVSRPEATRALARAAIFSADAPVRTAAIKALSARGKADYSALLIAGLRYPWPAVAENVARAIVALKRKDLIPQLESLLEEPDPRGPRSEEVAGRMVTVAPELVRINHHRNCMLCHAPAEAGKVPEPTLVAEVPVPSEPLPSSGSGSYGVSPPSLLRPPNVLVRIDVTYLRQDFSVVMPVYDSSAWRVMQRFDFVVRKRVLTPEEAEGLRARLAGDSPYRRAAAKALRELTGRDFRPRGKPLRQQL